MTRIPYIRAGILLGILVYLFVGIVFGLVIGVMGGAGFHGCIGLALTYSLWWCPAVMLMLCFRIWGG